MRAWRCERGGVTEIYMYSIAIEVHDIYYLSAFTAALSVHVTYCVILNCGENALQA